MAQIAVLAHVKRGGLAQFTDDEVLVQPLCGFKFDFGRRHEIVSVEWTQTCCQVRKCSRLSCDYGRLSIMTLIPDGSVDSLACSHW